MAFGIKRGVNISHWLSQSRQRGAARAEWFTAQDVQYIAGLRGTGGGYDHLRLPIDEVQMWDEEGNREEAAFDLLDASLEWYADMMATFNDHDIAWANWNYKGSFGIVTADGQDTGLAEVLLS